MALTLKYKTFFSCRFSQDFAFSSVVNPRDLVGLAVCSFLLFKYVKSVKKSARYPFILRIKNQESLMTS